MTDDISDSFDGVSTSFPLKKSGLPIPSSHLSTNSVWVQLGGITQIPEVSYRITTNSIEFLGEAPVKGTTCDIRVVTSEDNEKTLIVVPLYLNPSELNGSSANFMLTSPGIDISNLEITTGNTIVTLGGVEQLPTEAYTIETTRTEQSVQITFKGAPAESTVVDIRAICSGSFWAKQGIYPVGVYPLDDISPGFSINGQTTFLLTYQGLPVNPALVNTDNLLVSVGGAMQVPLHIVNNEERGSYSVQLDANNQAVIVFREPPAVGCTSDLRIITNAEFLPCKNSRGETSGFMKWGPSLVIGLTQEVDELIQDVKDLTQEINNLRG
jgi:hypothetical protein